MEFISHARSAHLDAILDADKVRVASPFLSDGTVARINNNRHKKFELITRLPTTYNYPAAFIENDPRPLRNAMERMGTKFKLYALPTLHAKLYINSSDSWTGSANFTQNGFSGKQELLLRFNGVNAELDRIFCVYKAQAALVSKANLNALISWIDDGLTEVGFRSSNAASTLDEPEGGGASYDSFLKWLAAYKGPHKQEAKTLLDRANGGNQMSGHVATGFNGVASFLRMNPDLRARLKAYNNTNFGPEILTPLSNFIKKHGNKYKGPNGGQWRNYLSVKIGGVQTTGGAGNSIVTKSLLLMPYYLDSKNI